MSFLILFNTEGRKSKQKFHKSLQNRPQTYQRVHTNKKPVVDNKTYKCELLTTFNTLCPHWEARLCCSNQFQGNIKLCWTKITNPLCTTQFCDLKQTRKMMLKSPFHNRKNETKLYNETFRTSQDNLPKSPSETSMYAMVEGFSPMIYGEGFDSNH